MTLGRGDVTVHHNVRVVDKAMNSFIVWEVVDILTNPVYMLPDLKYTCAIMGTRVIEEDFMAGSPVFTNLSCSERRLSCRPARYLQSQNLPSEPL